MASKPQIEKAFKYDGGKPRMDLLDPAWMTDVARVLTVGHEKYDESERVYLNNWRQGGMRWGQVYAAAQRHLNQFWAGEELDQETGLMHLAHAACNLMFLHYYARRARHLDDRDHLWRRDISIWMDIDGVIADWSGAIYNKLLERHPDSSFHRTPDDRARWWLWLDTKEWFAYQNEDKAEYERFMVEDVPAIFEGDELHFEPRGYVTHRGVSSGVTRKWLNAHGFPQAKLFTVAEASGKVDILLEHKVDIFVDDKFETFVECQNAGILCFLLDQPYNRTHDVGLYRIKHPNDILKRLT